MRTCTPSLPRTRVGAWLFLSSVLALAASGVAQAGPCRVTVTGGTSGIDGSNWTNEAMSLQTAMSNSTTCPEIWVKFGVYTPGHAQSDSFHILPGMAVYGGFAGNETMRSERNPAAHTTILSGDIDDNDTNNDGNSIDETAADIQGSNSYHVVFMDGTSSAGSISASTVLDGFTISGGNAEGAEGGGLYCDGSKSTQACSPTINNVSFRGNKAGNNGGAMYNNAKNGGASSPTISNSTFSGNYAGVNGTVFNLGDASTSSPTISNSTFSDNHAGNWGGAMVNAAIEYGTSSPIISNVTFNNNNAGAFGGAIYNFVVNGTSAPKLTNVIAWNDIAAGHASEIENYSTSATPSIDFSVIQGGCPAGSTCGGHLITANPELGLLADNGGSTQTMLPGAGSSAIDTGDDATCQSLPVNGLDQRGVSRPQGPHCDIGAVEVVVDEIFKNGFEN